MYPKKTNKKFLLQSFYLISITLFILSGCLVKTTHVVDKQGFTDMVSCIGPILQDRDIITCKNNYAEPLFPDLTHPLPENTGEYLFYSLSSNVQNNKTEPHITFAKKSTHHSQVSINQFGFTLQQDQFITTVKLLAQLDWYNQGNKDWLLLCRIKTLNKPSFVDYYLIVTPPLSNKDLLQPELIAIRDSASKTCTITTDFIQTSYDKENVSCLSFIEVDPGFFSIVDKEKSPQTQEEQMSITEESLKE